MTNSTSPEYTSGWRREPGGRGTWYIISTCLVTLFLCVWTALHLNIPPKRDQQATFCKLRLSKLRFCAHKLSWVLVGILAPEVTVYMAWRQWLSARALTKKINKYRRKLNTSSRHDWKHMHSFFAAMGGFVLDYSGHSTKLECPSLTAKAILYTAQTEPGLLDFSEDSINSRSRADGLSKLFVCTQASYMILQVIGRLVSHLPVTLLEVNTLCHVLCALALYFFWFHKPLDVIETISIQPKWAGPLDAVWSMRHRDFDIRRTRDSRYDKDRDRVKEREVFDHFRHETLRLLYSKQVKISVDRVSALDMNTENSLHQCHKCGKPERPAPPQNRIGSEVDSARGSCRPNTTQPDSSVKEAAALRDRMGGQSGHTSATPSASQIAEEYRVSIAAGNIDVAYYRNYKARTLPTHPQDAEEIVWNVAYSGRELDPGPPIDNERLVRATKAISFPSAEEWSKSVTITRERPDRFDIDTWEETELVLIWHSFDNDINDQSVKERLARTPLWNAVTHVILLDGYMPNETFFRTEPDPAFRGKDVFAKAQLLSKTSMADRICAIQLDTAGIRRWEAAFEAACEAKIMSTGNLQVTLDKAVMARMKKDMKKNLSIQSGFDLRGALQRWEASQDNDFLREEISNWPGSEEYLESLKKFLPKVSMAIITALYGGLHVLAWHSEYPTPTERQLWRISTLVTAVSRALAGPVFLLRIWFERKTLKPESKKQQEPIGATELLTTINDVEFQPARWNLPNGVFVLNGMVIYLLLILIAIGYSLARVYIVLEAFMSLRSLPVGAFETPQWTDLLLHW